jgi:hypothetical protein
MLLVKKYALIPLIFLFVFSVKTSLAQFRGMGGVRASMNMRFVNQQNGLFLNMQTLRGADYVYNEKYDFMVTMLDGSKKLVRSKIYVDTATDKNYLLLVNKNLPKTDPNRNQKIYPSQTLSIDRDVTPGGINIDDPPPEKKVYFTGIAKDSCWMFKVLSGPITVYSYLTEHNSQLFDPVSIVGIQFHDGPIVAFNAENLKAIIGQDDLDALEIIQHENYYRAIKKYNRDKEKDAKSAKH